MHRCGIYVLCTCYGCMLDYVYVCHICLYTLKMHATLCTMAYVTLCIYIIYIMYPIDIFYITCVTHITLSSLSFFITTHSQSARPGITTYPYVMPTTAMPISVCPICGAIVKSGKRSCCARGASWFKKCGDDGDNRFEYTWTEGIQACKGALCNY